MLSLDNGDDEEKLQRALEAHGQQFLAMFDSSAIPSQTTSSQGSSRKKRKLSVPDEYEEWTGFGTQSSSSEQPEGSVESFVGEQVDHDHDEFVVGGSHQPDVVIFDSTTKRAPAGASSFKAQMKAFMSSKLSNMRKSVREIGEDDKDSLEDNDNLTNIQNDALLHRLVHTKLLSGSLEPDIGIKPSKRRKALTGRVLEVAGQAKLGKGEGSARKAEHNKASKKIRDGILAKEEKRSKKTLADAKDVGNYHPVLKQLYEANASQNNKRKRERGLRMGVGSFSGGVLKLSRSEIEVMRSTEDGSSRVRGRGRGGKHRRG